MVNPINVMARPKIIQMAYVVPDVREAINVWVNDMGAGPWFMVEALKGEDPIYRGAPTEASYCLASTFVGDMQIELIGMNDAHPSPFREWVDARGYGFHHVAIGSDDADADVRDYEQRGYETVFRCGTPFGSSRIAFMSAGANSQAMVEITPMVDGLVAFHEMSKEASRNWNGEDPIRVLG